MEAITTQTVQAPSGKTRTDIRRAGNVIGSVGHLPGGRGFVAFDGNQQPIGSFTDFIDAQRAVTNADQLA